MKQEIGNDDLGEIVPVTECTNCGEQSGRAISGLSA